MTTPLSLCFSVRHFPFSSDISGARSVELRFRRRDCAANSTTHTAKVISVMMIRRTRSEEALLLYSVCIVCVRKTFDKNRWSNVSLRWSSANRWFLRQWILLHHNKIRDQDVGLQRKLYRNNTSVKNMSYIYAKNGNYNGYWVKQQNGMTVINCDTRTQTKITSIQIRINTAQNAIFIVPDRQVSPVRLPHDR